MPLPTVQASGNIVFEPDLQFTQSGMARCRLRIACNQRKKVDGEFVDGDPVFVDVVLWRGLAEAAAEQLVKGQPVTVTGKLNIRSYEDKTGATKTAVEIEADTIGSNVRPVKASAPAPADDVWATEVPF